MKRRSCESCGKPLEAGASSRAKYCKRETCVRARARSRKRSERQPSNVVELKPAATPEGTAISVYEATWSELDRAGQVQTTTGQSALALAHRLDHGSTDTGSGLAALAKQLQTLMADALKDVAVPGDPVIVLAERRRRRQQAAGG